MRAPEEIKKDIEKLDSDLYLHRQEISSSNYSDLAVLGTIACLSISEAGLRVFCLWVIAGYYTLKLFIYENKRGYQIKANKREQEIKYQISQIDETKYSNEKFELQSQFNQYKKSNSFIYLIFKDKNKVQMFNFFFPYFFLFATAIIQLCIL